MSKSTEPANAQAFPDEQRFRIAHLVCDPVLRAALGSAENELGPIPLLPNRKPDASGLDSAKSIFHRACLEAELEAARHEVIQIEFSIARPKLKGDELAALHARRDVSAARMRDAQERLAAVPAMDHDQLARKTKLIFLHWRNKAPFSDAIARDKAYLEARGAARKEAAR